MSRRSIRLPANGNVRVEMPNMKVKVELRDLGFGGFAIVAPRPFCKGLTHWFSFASGMGEPVTLVAKAVHCQALGDRSGFVSGWEFMRGTADRTEAAIGQLLDALV